jgi:mRNA interferase MazF
MRHGDIFWVVFDPAQGGEIRKARPAIVVSNDIANRMLNRVQVVPLTTSVGRLFPSETVVQVNGVAHKAMADQIRTVAKERLRDFVGILSAADMAGVDLAIRRRLGLR